MLTSEITKKIQDFVYQKPRSIQEIAQHINKNWRTADRYVEEIEKEFGTLSTRTFREGTRGALKIVYWASMEKASSSIFQERLENEIKSSKKKEDFSAFDIYQYIDDKNKKATMEQSEEEAKTNLKDLKEILENTEKQLLCFSGNLSWINLATKEINIFKEIEKLVKKGVKIKFLCMVDITSLPTIEKVLSLNFKYGKEVIEIHHCEQPLRALVVDNKLIRLKEVKEPTSKKSELKNRIFLFYTIKDKEWVEWLSKIFWNMFSNSIDSKKRIEEFKKLKNISNKNL